MKIGKKIITIVLAFILFGGSVFAEIKQREQVEETKEEGLTISFGEATVKRDNQNLHVTENSELMEGDIIFTSQNETAGISLNEAKFQLSSNTSLRIASVTPAGLLVILQEGKIWINHQFALQPVHIQAGNVVFIPEKAHINLTFDGDKGNLLVYKNQVKVGLLNSTNALEKPLGSDDANIINSFLVSEKNQITFATSTIASQTEALTKLLYSKLVKEFQYGIIDSAKWENDQWLKENIKNDENLVNKKGQTLLEIIHQKNLHYSSLDAFGYQLNSAISRFASVLTFSDSKNFERLLTNIFAQLSDAEYLLVYGRTNEAKERLSFFQQSIADFIEQKPQARTLVLEKLNKSYHNLEFVLPDDPLYEAKNTLNDVIFSSRGNTAEDLMVRFRLLHDLTGSVSEMASKNAALARVTLDQYFKKLAEFLPKEKKLLSEKSSLLAEENQMVDNLFRRYAEFYQDSFFAQKYNLERQWLSLLPEGNAKNEERQTIISTKIDFLKQLQSFFLAQKISLQESRRIAFRLINEIKDLQPSNDVGVKELFALRLKDYGQFLRFLNNTDVASFQNSSPQKRYEEFLAAQKEVITIEQAVDEFLGTQTQGNLSVRQILEKAQNDFEAAAITNVTFGNITSSEQKNIPVENAVYQNIVFSAEYDWDRKLISNIKVENEVKGQNPIRLENLGQVLLQQTPQTQETQETQVKTPRVPRVPTGETQQTQATSSSDAAKSERVTKVLLIQKLKGYDIAATENAIVIIDKAAGIFTIRDATLISNKNIIFDFRVNNKEGTADLITLKKIIPKTLEGSFTLSELSTQLKAIR